MLKRSDIQRAHHERAFTLVELLIVMAIILLLAAVALPSVRSLLHGQKVTQASRMVQAHIESAHSRAIAAGSQVAVILERLGTENNTTTRLSIGQVFPPYEGDITGATGTLIDSNGDSFYDQIEVEELYGSLIEQGVFRRGDFIQFGDRERTFLISGPAVASGSRNILPFYNPVTWQSTAVQLQEPQLPTSSASAVTTFRIFRKPTKSFVQSTVLPRGTCVDLSVSGVGPSGDNFFSTASQPVMIVFDERGSVAYLTDGGLASLPQPVSGIVHLMIGRTEQVSVGSRLAMKNDADSTSFNANLNDTENSWVSINPYSGAIYASAINTGFETGRNSVDDDLDGQTDELDELVPHAIKSGEIVCNVCY